MQPDIISHPTNPSLSTYTISLNEKAAITRNLGVILHYFSLSDPLCPVNKFLPTTALRY